MFYCQCQKSPKAYTMADSSKRSMSPECKIGPSILNADLASLADECDRLMAAGADYLHLDVMDGHFVPNITFGHPVVKCLRTKNSAFFDMHMMVSEPEKWIEEMAAAGANQYTFHVEATENPERCIRLVREAGMKVGIGIKPGTPVEAVLPFVPDVDMVLVMTVEPGFGGQSFMADMMPKVQALRSRYKMLDIEVDGGVGPTNIDTVAEAGANMIVSGTAVVRADNPQNVISLLKQRVQNCIHKSSLER